MVDVISLLDLLRQFSRTARLTFYGGAPFCLVDKDVLTDLGAIFGPCISTWYRYLNMIKFSTPTRALASRVRFHS